MKVFITGGSGLVGSNCAKVFSERKHEVLSTWYSHPVPGALRFDTIKPNKSQLAEVRGFNPDLIIHAGALTHVDRCETEPEESRLNTVASTQNMLKLAKELGAKLVLLSTDYIFDGKEGPYREDERANPLCVYGRHKLEAEILVRESGQPYLIIRITNVYGEESRGKNFVARLVKAAMENEDLHLRLPMDQYATPVNASDVARAIELLAKDGHDGVYHIASTDYMNRVQLAQRVLQYFPSPRIHIEPLPTHLLGQTAQRPLLGGLVAARFNCLYPTFGFTMVGHYLSALSRD